MNVSFMQILATYVKQKTSELQVLEYKNTHSSLSIFWSFLLQDMRLDIMQKDLKKNHLTFFLLATVI